MVNGSLLALSWRNTASGGAASTIRVTVTGSLSVTLDLPGSAESFTFPSVPAGSYTFTVTAINASGTSAPSNPVTLSFPGACTGVPLAPTAFQVTRSGRTITVTWDAPTLGPAVTGYALDVSGSFVGSFATTSRAMAGTVGPGTYTISVKASNPCGTGPSTASQTVTVP
jgi:predicted phage tail protein